MHLSLDWLGPASSIATVAALIVTLLYYLYWWPFNLKKPEILAADHENVHVKLRWKPIHRASSYNIYRTNVKSGVMDIYSCTTHHHIDTALAAGEVYQYYVIAEDQGHQSPQSDVVSVKAPISLPPPIEPNVDLDSPEAQWPVEDLLLLFAELQQKNNKTVLAILTIAASRPDTLVLFSDVCERVGVTGRQGGAGIGALTLLIKRLGKTKWPFTHHPSQTGQYYKLSEEMAKRWRQVEAEAKN